MLNWLKKAEQAKLELPEEILPLLKQKLSSPNGQRAQSGIGHLSSSEHYHDSNEQPSHGRLHHKLTLKTGAVHWKRFETSAPRQLLIAADPHPSCQAWLGGAKLRELQYFFHTWGRRQHIQVHFLQAQTCGGWSEKLCQQWQNNIPQRFSSAKLLLISDFHHPHPSSQHFLKLLTRHETGIVCLEHETPTQSRDSLEPAIGKAHDINQSHVVHDMDKLQLDERYQTWIQERERCFKKTGVIVQHLNSNRVVDTIKASFRSLGATRSIS